jgi:hypothetical protein
MKLTTRVGLLKTRVLSLERAIVLQKRKQAKGTRLNILGEEQNGDALLISPVYESVLRSFMTLERMLQSRRERRKSAAKLNKLSAVRKRSRRSRRLPQREL